MATEIAKDKAHPIIAGKCGCRYRWKLDTKPSLDQTEGWETVELCGHHSAVHAEQHRRRWKFTARRRKARQTAKASRRANR